MDVVGDLKDGENYRCSSAHMKCQSIAYKMHKNILLLNYIPTHNYTFNHIID